MPRAEIVEIVPRKSKKDRHIRVRFVCPTCQGTHIIRMTVFDKIKDGKYPCVGRQKSVFKAWVNNEIDSMPANKRKEIESAWADGKSFKSIAKKSGVRHIAVVHAICSPTRSRAVQAVKALPTAAPSPTIVNHYHAPVYQAPVTNLYEATKPVEIPVDPIYKRPMPGTVAFDKLPFRERLEIQGELARIQKECN